MNYREHRIPTSLERHVGAASTSPEAIRALVRKARAAGVVVFLRDELATLPDMARMLIEGEHRRLCERERRMNRRQLGKFARHASSDGLTGIRSHRLGEQYQRAEKQPSTLWINMGAMPEVR